MAAEDDFDAAVRRHDERIAARGLTIWVGSEPTYTDRQAQTPEWLSQALGGDKQARAQALLGGLCRRFPGGTVLRSVGRQYPGEALPRWSLGLIRRRDGVPLWQGPPDPLWLPPGGAGALPDLDRWARALQGAFGTLGHPASLLAPVQDGERRVVLRADERVAAPQATDARLQRPSVHAGALPAAGLRDELAEAGLHLFTLRLCDPDGAPAACVELPHFAAVPLFLAALQGLAQASRECGIDALVLAGYPPPVDATLEWTTVTPDPAVVEVNSAPSLDGCDFLRRSREIHAAAEDAGLAPYRLYFNGNVADSGGGGQITLGGPNPLASPFLQVPGLLPRLLRFLNRHPSLSYLFSHDFVGSSGQSVRPDERGSDAFDELQLALALLERQPAIEPARLWQSLAPFLSDPAGNSHRAEVNIEKLWNPYLALRGRQGLVEFRALRMQHTPERATALACLLRATVALLAGSDFALPLVDWGRELHDRYALPFYLERDLQDVLQALDGAGLGLGAAMRAVLLRESFRRWGAVDLPGARVEVRRALEFWPLLGDAASPEQGGGSRLVDASTARIELRLRGVPEAVPDGPGWQVQTGGVELPLRDEHDGDGELRVFGIRYRCFAPTWGLHPTLGVQAPLRLLLRHAAARLAFRLTLHEWQPQDEAYPGLPADLAEAARRRAERLTLEALPWTDDARPLAAPPHALSPCHLDLRYL